jgi:hypothetical protein
MELVLTVFFSESLPHQLKKDRPMASCHICGNSYYEEHGIEFYSGSVRHVPTSVWFWERVFSKTHVSETGGALEGLIREKMDAWRVGAYICDDCHDELMADCRYDLPKDNETLRHRLVSEAAGKAWQNLYGHWPAGIRKPAPSAPPVTVNAGQVKCNKCSQVFDNKLWACPACGHTRLDNLIALFVLTVAFNGGAVALALTRHYVWAVVVGLIGIALIVTSGPEIRKLW